MLNKAVIDLRAIKDNANIIKQKLPHGTRLCGVVKANAYGHGGVKVANAVYSECDCFAVALPEEGRELRLGGIDKEVLVFSRPFREDIDVYFDYGLTLTVVDEKDLATIERAGAKRGECAAAHIKYNTGMNRLGVDGLGALVRLIDYAQDCPHVKISGIYSHYADPQNVATRNLATEKFMSAAKIAKQRLGNITAHISASGGFLAGEYFDMVRIGILLYGYKPFESNAVKVTPAMRVYAPVVARRDVAAGESALYGHCPTRKRTHIDIVRYGYADGLPRTLVSGQFNARCMDVSASTRRVKGRWAAVLKDADELAERYSTISYEILCKAALRARKIYVT